MTARGGWAYDLGDRIAADGGSRRDSFAQFPIQRPGFAPPPPLPSQRPVMIALQEALTVWPGNVGLSRITP